MARRGGELLSRNCDASPQAHPDPFDAPIPRVLTASAASPRHAVVLSEPGKHWKKHRQLGTTTRVQTAAPFLRKLGVVLSEPGRSRAGRDSRVPRGLRPQSCRLNPPTTPPKPWSHCRGQEAPSEYTRRPVSRNGALGSPAGGFNGPHVQQRVAWWVSVVSDVHRIPHTLV